MSLGKNPPPRIIKITYKARESRRKAVAYAKVPYSGLFDLNEKLARMLATREIEWFRIDEAKPVEIAQVRDSLQRWLPALEATSTITKVDWSA